MSRLIAFALVPIGSGCGEQPTAELEADPAPIALIRPENWRATSPDEDPLAEHRPDPLPCEPGAWREELGGTELDTGRCGYLSLSQPSAATVEAGDLVELAVWWQDLASLEPARGHLAVLAGTELLWEEYVDIPSPADIREVAFRVDRPIPAGTPITLHLHNHGANTWHFHHLLVTPESPLP
ncbi:MAG: hypothetical protein B7733_17515 [Myxococcales bacterium FL481]|nr:MAG: hypothetical protein B7733_17515 [Myxococcales bacterium FL481]